MEVDNYLIIFCFFNNTMWLLLCIYFKVGIVQKRVTSFGTTLSSFFVETMDQEQDFVYYWFGILLVNLRYLPLGFTFFYLYREHRFYTFHSYKSKKTIWLPSLLPSHYFSFFSPFLSFLQEVLQRLIFNSLYTHKLNSPLIMIFNR